MRACRDLADPIFLFDGSDSHAQAVTPVLELLGPTQDLRELGGVGDALAVNTVVTFSETMLPATARLAEGRGFATHSMQTVERLTNKWKQREAFRHRGIPVPDYRLIRSAADFDDALQRVGAPGILKPNVGSGSVDTFRIDERAGAMAVPPYLLSNSHREFIYERLLDGAPHPTREWLGDYVSVETLSSGGAHEHLVILDKTPLAPPFREAGEIIPSTLPEDWQTAVQTAAGEALDALGVRDGVSHTEVKLTAAGPRIIEVNGRIGGPVPGLLMRAASFDIARTAIEIALGRRPKIPEFEWRQFTFQYDAQPPLNASRLIKSIDLQGLREIPGIYAAHVHRILGDFLDPQNGTAAAVCSVFGEAPEIDSVRSIIEQVDSIALAPENYDL